MMNKARGPVWHQKQKIQGIVPSKLRGLDKEATWSYSNADSWVYGHGIFCMTSHKLPVIGILKWIPNSAHEGKVLEREIIKYQIKNVCMDSKADDCPMYFALKNRYKIQLITNPRTKMNKTELRRKMIEELKSKKLRKLYKERSYTVEPMQGLVKDIFDLDVCWMRGDRSNRWIFAAMGVAVQIAQANAVKQKLSTWNVKKQVLGL
jgi:hypothetical protein